MAHDDEKPDAGEDPWGGLEAEGLPDLEGDFSFSFDDESVPEESRPEESRPEESRPEEFVPEEFVPEESAEASSTESEPAEPAPPVEEVVVGDGVEDAAIDDWLTEGDAASSILPFETPGRAVFDGSETADATSSESMVEIGTGTSGISSPGSIESAADSAADGADAAEDADLFASLSAEEAVGAEVEMFAFATEAAGAVDSAEVDEFAPDATPGDDDGDAEGIDAIDAFAAVGAAGAAGALVTDQARPAGDAEPGPSMPPRRPSAPRRKQPSMVGQIVGVIFGGALAIPITLAILLWGLGKDPVGLAPLVPESLAFLLPPSLRPGPAPGPDAIDLAAAPTLDAVVGEAGAGDAGAGGPPDAIDVAVDEPVTSPVVQPAPEPTAEPEPVADAAPELAAATATAEPAEPADDPLMDLLDEGQAAPPPAPVVAAPAPPSEPEPPAAPEPLDLAELDAAVAGANAALEAALAVADPTDPVRRRLLAKWYKALAGYAEQLASLESLAAETGRPFEPAAERADAMRETLAEHPQLLEELGVLSRDWIAYAKRPSDGLVMAATFGAARRAGPYWRSQVTLPATGERPAREMVVLTRVEPAVVPGDAVMVTGLVVDDDVVWAAEVRPAAGEAGGIPGL